MLDGLRLEQGLDPDLLWGGRSPRVLTEAYIRFSLSQEASSLDEFFDEEVIDEQCRRHQHGS